MWRLSGHLSASRGQSATIAADMADVQTTTTALIASGSALAGALIGGSVTIVAEVLRGRGARGDRQRERQAALDDLQRQTLIDLQDALASWITTIGEIDFEYSQAQAAGRPFILTIGNSERARRELAERLTVHKLLGRVRDTTTREHGREVFQVGIDALAGSAAYEQLHARVEGFTRDAARFHEVLSAELRRYL
jgi:hypothetical protein